MRYICTFLILIASVSGIAQTQFMGKVIDDSSHKGIGWVSVVAENSAHKPVAFTQTKENGTFTLNVPAEKECSFITFSMVGFSKETLAANQFSNGQIVKLKESQLMLKEVKVTSNRLNRHKDTLTYSVAGFRQKQDRSIADVIAKMPGLEVQANGTIKYQGKAIGNFYVEGMDLMGSNYSLASENLQAVKVKEVQVLTNHQRIQALHNVEFSDHAALNLVLEEDAKNTWMGVLEVGAGATLQQSPAERLLRDGRLMAMMFGGKMQTISMYKWNNMGKDITNEIKDLTNTGRSIGDVRHMTAGIGMETPDLSQKHYLMNDSRLLATNWLRKTAQGATLRLQISGCLDETIGQRAVQTTYNDLMGGTIINEETHGKRNSSEWKGQLKYEKNDTSLFVSQVLSGYIDFNRSRGETFLNATSVLQKSEPHKQWINWTSQVVKPLRNNRILQFNASAGYSYMPGNLLLNDSTLQHIDQHATQATFNTQFRHKLFGRFYISYQAGVDYNEQRFTLTRERETPQSDQYRQLNGYLKPSLNLQYDLVRWTFNVPLRVVNRRLGDSNNTKIIVEPSTSIEYQLSSMLAFRASYAYNWRPSTLSDLTSVPVYTNYLSFTTGIGELYASETHRIGGRLEYTNPISGLFGTIDGTYTYLKKEPVYNNLLDGFVYHREATGEYRNRRLLTVSGRISKALGNMKSLIALSGSMTKTYSIAMLGGCRLPFRYDNYQMGVNFSFRPLQILSFEGKSSFQYLKQVSTSNHSFDSRGLRSFKHELKTFIMPGKWQIEIDNEIFHSNDHSVPFCHFSDVQVSYRTKKLEASLCINNVLGTKDYERQYVSNYSTTYMISRLRPRDFLAKISVDI